MRSTSFWSKVASIYSNLQERPKFNKIYQKRGNKQLTRYNALDIELPIFHQAPYLNRTHRTHQLYLTVPHVSFGCWWWEFYLVMVIIFIFFTWLIGHGKPFSFTLSKISSPWYLLKFNYQIEENWFSKGSGWSSQPRLKKFGKIVYFCILFVYF